MPHIQETDINHEGRILSLYLDLAMRKSTVHQNVFYELINSFWYALHDQIDA